MDIVFLPSILLLIGAALKLFVGRAYSIPNVITALCELPVDIIFLAISFAVTFTIATKPQNSSYGLGCCFVGILVAILIIVLWRATLDLFMRRKIVGLVLILLLNLCISGLSLVKAIDLVTEDHQKAIANQKDTTQKDDK